MPEFVTEKEITDFVEGLFTGSNPKVNPSWETSGLIDPNSIPETVEYATKSEVNAFIKNLFNK